MGQSLGPHSISWEVNCERFLLLSGPRALLLQLAHPKVAAGVSDHSDFMHAPVARLRRTLDLTLGIVFGDEAEAQKSARQINHVHERVRGELQDATQVFSVGTSYSALDPELLLWVHATLLESAVLVFEQFVRPLSNDERERFYQESKRTAILLRVSEQQLPPDYAAFASYWRKMLEGPEIEVTPTARRLAEGVIYPNIPFFPRFLGDAGNIVTAALLPPRIRGAYGIGFDPWKRRAWQGVRRTLRLALPYTPAAIRYMPQARRGYARCGAPL